MKTADALKRDVLDALEFQPEVRASSIGVAVEDDGVVTLSGHVPTYFEKEAAETIVKGVAGVRALANDLQVRVTEGAAADDTDHAIAVRHALEWHLAVPDERITAVVEHGHVTLEGEVDWRYQREAAERAVAVLPGVKSIENRITIAPTAAATNLAHAIEESIQRDAALAGQHIKVEVAGTTAILRGTVRSRADRDAAEETAASARGITDVENHLAPGVPLPFET